MLRRWSFGECKFDKDAKSGSYSFYADSKLQDVMATCIIYNGARFLC